jgi:uncharacterized protein (TIGR02996 family)
MQRVSIGNSHPEGRPVTSAEESAFLQAITDEPDDDLPRLVYADWLDERGDPFGEFIRLQCERARMEPDGSGDERLTARINTRDVALWKSPEVRDGVLRAAGRPSGFEPLAVAMPEAQGLAALFRRENVRLSGLIHRGILEELIVPSTALNGKSKSLKSWPRVVHPTIRVRGTLNGLKSIHSTQPKKLTLDFTRSRYQNEFRRPGSSSLRDRLMTDLELPALKELLIRVHGQVDIRDALQWMPLMTLEPLARAQNLPRIERIILEVVHVRWDCTDDPFTLRGISHQFDRGSHVVHCEYQSRIRDRQFLA